MLVSSKEMIIRAYQEGYAVPAFNVSNLEILKGVMQAAEVKKSPVILSVTETIISYAGLPYIFSLAKSAAEISSVPVAIHLDHGKNLEIVKKCLEIGFTSIMIDGSVYPFEENVSITKAAVDLCHANNIPVEGEIGQLSDEKEKMANPIESKDYIAKTNIDFLAPAIGTSHGIKSNEKINFDLLSEVHKASGIPLVLHGASGVKDDEIKKAIKLGISKVNIHTELRVAFISGLKQGISQYPNTDDHREILKFSITNIQNKAEDIINILGSSGKI